MFVFITRIIGIILLLGCAVVSSRNWRMIKWRTATMGLGIHMILVLLLLANTYGQRLMQFCAEGIKSVQDATHSGVEFIFGSLAMPTDPWGFMFAIHGMPLVIVFSAIISLFMFFGVIPWIMRVLNRPMRFLLGTSGAETVCAVANSFLGQTEAPLLIKNVLTSMTESQIFIVMVSGMASISAAAVAIYSKMGIAEAQHLLCASILVVPASIVMAKIIIPDEKDTKKTDLLNELPRGASNMFEAISTGALDALVMVFNSGAILIAFISLVSLTDMILSATSVRFGMQAYHLKDILGFLCAPFGWLIGLRGSEVWIAGKLFGARVLINEVVAYRDLLTYTLSDRAVVIITYALCGFANISSIGVQIGAIGALAPSIRPMLSKLGGRALWAASLANFLSAAIVGLFV